MLASTRLALGLGGVAVGTLLVLTLLPDLRITDQLVVVRSVVVPIWLGIYWAWLASHAAAVRLSLLTAIAGALGQPARVETEMLDVRDHQPATPTGSACPDGSVTGYA